MAQLIAGLDFSNCALGPIENWPGCLKAAVNLALPADAQIVIFAGKDYIALYNDAYAPTIGDKHPHALGRPASEGWAELWQDLGPLLERVRTTGETVSAKDRPFEIDRHGFIEKVHFDISYSPIQDELGHVHAVLCIVSETTERVEALKAERRLAAIVSSSSDAILGMDLDQRVTDWNRGAETLYGYRKEEILGQPVTVLVPSDRPDEEDVIMAQIMNGEQIETHETQRLRRDGTLIDVSLTVSPIHDTDGKVIGASKIARDITDRKKSERLQQILVGELHHRVKNVLATVQVIANQSFGSADPERYRAFSDRLRALSQAHSLLTQQSWEGATLHSVVAGVSKAFGRERFSFDGPELRLPPRSVVTLSMALHELATNAAKYGALSTPPGEISIRWVHCPERENFRMIWEERGGPRVSVPAKRGFGSLLIKDALAAELNGEVELTYEETGVVCIVRAPIDASWD